MAKLAKHTLMGGGLSGAAMRKARVVSDEPVMSSEPVDSVASIPFDGSWIMMTSLRCGIGSRKLEVDGVVVEVAAMTEA